MIQFHGLESFFQMGGVAIYVWPAFAIVFALLLSNVFIIYSQLRRVKRMLKKSYKSVLNESST